MRIDNSILILFNLGKSSVKKPKYNSLIDVLLKSKTSGRTFDVYSTANKKNAAPVGIYNNKGRFGDSPKYSEDIWDSNNERLPDNYNPAFLSRPKSIKQMLNELPEHLRYKGKLTSKEIAEKYATTGEITDAEYEYLFMVNCPLWYDARDKALIPKTAKLVNQALTASGITINPDEELRISVDRNIQITVDGINDPERREKIREALQSFTIKNQYSSSSLAGTIRSAYFNNSQNVDKFSIEERSLNLATITASHYLYNATGGKVTLDDLSIVGGKITGLPPELNEVLNGGNLKGIIVNGQNLEGVRVCIMQVKAYEAKYGKENLPFVASTFTYKGGKLNLIEDPELPKKMGFSSGWPVAFDETLRLIDNNPLLFYNRMTGGK